MITISKSFLFNPARIRVSGIKCNFKNITEIVKLFDCKWIVLTIDSLPKYSSLIALIKNQEFKINLKPYSPDYIEVSTITPYSQFEDILDGAISEYPENIFVSDCMDPKNWDTYLRCSDVKLIDAGISNVFISISLDENALSITVNKSTVQPRELYKKIKALRLDS